MERKNTPAPNAPNNHSGPRVVRGTKPNRGRRKKPLTKGQRIAKTIAATVGKVFLTAALVLTITGCIVGTALTIYVMQFIDSDAAIILTDLKMNYTTTVYGIDANGNDTEIQSLDRGESRTWVDYAKIPQHVRDAFVYLEDERFYQHDGVDFKRTFAAVVNLAKNVLHIGEDSSLFGGSTITQQLIKNINGDIQNRTIDVKIKEIMQAMNLERHYTKDQILEAYLNYLGLGNGVSGVQAASKYYFDKDVSELTINEAAALAITTKSPNRLNPKYDGVDAEGVPYAERRDNRRKYCLDKMLEFGAITQAEHDQYYNVPVFAVEKSSSAEEDEEAPKTSNVQNYFIDALIEEVIADLMDEYSYSYDYAQQLLYTKGWKIYSTEEIETQKILEKYFTNEDTFKVGNLKEEQIPQAAMVIMDLNGNVRALVGGKGEKTIARGFNRATQAKRSFGSTIKPLSIYSQAFEKGIINWSSIMEDSPITIIGDDGKERNDYPKNFNGKYDGNMLIIDALKVSKNTIPVKLSQMMTPEASFDFMTNKLHFQDLRGSGTYNDVTLGSMALGDGGTTLVDLVNAYQIFGNGGNFSDHKMYTKVLDSEGKVLLDATRSETRVLSSQTAYIMNRGLWQVVNGGATPVGNPSGTAGKLSQWETIGKTGTSNDRKDLLFMGVTPYYTAGIRYGFDDNNSVISNSIGSAHIKVWNKVMEEVHKGKNAAKFELDAKGVEPLEYCLESGLLAGPDCEKKATGYYNITQTLPTQCDIHGGTGDTSSNEMDDGFDDSEPTEPSE